MKSHWFYILLSVSSAPRYGSAIHDDVREVSEGAVRLWPATLYGSLEELVQRGWLEEVGEEERPEGIAGRERFYRLTPLGREVLEGEVARMELLAGVARSRLASARAGG
ncbi:MAG TPA: PadR family transcriptional regulator [Longimicrobiales bacterium]|nr:PadR family transcriptional regulator [Longimicrobiales bacterium]